MQIYFDYNYFVVAISIVELNVVVRNKFDFYHHYMIVVVAADAVADVAVAAVSLVDIAVAIVVAVVIHTDYDDLDDDYSIDQLYQHVDRLAIDVAVVAAAADPLYNHK